MELYKTPLILDSNTLQITDLIYKFHLCLEFEEEVLILNMITNLREFECEEGESDLLRDGKTERILD